jgi:AraC family transcriptional regulator, regulatory protein of adaptative response / methylated-DNA-[protein]-cysteine methyltransferase
MVKVMIAPQVVNCPTRLDIAVAQKPPRLVRWGYHPSPFGKIIAAIDENHRLCRLDFAASGKDEILSRWRQQWGDTAEFTQDPQATVGIIAQMINSMRPPWPVQKVSLFGTPFQLSVWKALAKIPYGKMITYGDVARMVGKPAAVRAVGAAVGANPIAILVPCHRVIASDGSLHGYASGLPLKRKLLAAEGIPAQQLFDKSLAA